MYPFIEQGHHILLIWGGSVNAEILKSTVERIKELTGPNGKVSIENIERLLLASYAPSSFDVVLSGILYPQSIVHSIELLGEIARIVKPQGKVVLQEATVEQSAQNGLKTREKLFSTLKICGFVDVCEPSTVAIEEKDKDNLKSILHTSETLEIVEVLCNKPNFEVGSSAKLSFANSSVQAKPSPEIASVWKLNSTDDDLETIDSSTLLDEKDLEKPDPASLRVCGTTGKRKACKNCSCGLAEELAAENNSESKPDNNTKSSACGNCYLGDAFRCASCPYLGMPAFKPGEKVQLSSNQLKADL